MALPVQSLKDFFLTESRWQRPSSRGEDTIFNRFTFNLLYYLPSTKSIICCLWNCDRQFMFGWIGISNSKYWISTRNTLYSTCLWSHDCFHAFLRMPNVKIVDKSIYYERLLSPTIMGCIFENIGMEPSLKYIQYRMIT